MSRISHDEFIERSIGIYGNRYDYSETLYTDSSTPVILTCNKCKRRFTERPSSHTNATYLDKMRNRDGCTICNSESRNSKIYFINKSKEIHGDEYDYTLVREYEVALAKVEIIHKKCSKSFLQTKNAHTRGDGCPHCFQDIKRTTEQFVEDAQKLHGDDYDYSLVDYKGLKVEVDIICNCCSEAFKEKPIKHLHTKTKVYISHCPNCYSYSRNLTTEEFIIKAKAIHGDKYDYSEVEYVNAKSVIKIKCNQCDNKFEQIPNAHLATRSNNMGGCLSCATKVGQVSVGERTIAEYLESCKIEYIQQYTDSRCKYKSNGVLRFDFYIPELNLLIEYDGAQHFVAVDFFGGEESFKRTQIRDKIKNSWAKENGFNLVRFKYDNFCLGILENTINEFKFLYRKQG